MLFETNSFSVSFDVIKMHHMCKLITIRMSEHMLLISCKGATKLRLRLEAKKIRTYTLCFASVKIYGLKLLEFLEQ